MYYYEQNPAGRRALLADRSRFLMLNKNQIHRPELKLIHQKILVQPTRQESEISLGYQININHASISCQRMNTEVQNSSISYLNNPRREWSGKGTIPILTLTDLKLRFVSIQNLHLLWWYQRSSDDYSGRIHDYSDHAAESIKNARDIHESASTTKLVSQLVITHLCKSLMAIILAYVLSITNYMSCCLICL